MFKEIAKEIVNLLWLADETGVDEIGILLESLEVNLDAKQQLKIIAPLVNNLDSENKAEYIIRLADFTKKYISKQNPLE